MWGSPRFTLKSDVCLTTLPESKEYIVGFELQICMISDVEAISWIKSVFVSSWLLLCTISQEWSLKLCWRNHGSQSKSSIMWRNSIQGYDICSGNTVSEMGLEYFTLWESVHVVKCHMVQIRRSWPIRVDAENTRENVQLLLYTLVSVKGQSCTSLSYSEK